MASPAKCKYKMEVMRVDALIEEQVTKAPDAVAIECQSAVLTYKQLWSRAEAVKSALVQLPPGPIGLLLPRGLNIGPAILGTFRADRAVVPMDIQWPLERVATALETAKCSALIAEDPAKWTQAAGNLPVFQIEQMLKTPVKPGSPSKEADESIATILFTSGSTGKPKGVLLSHRYLHTLVSGIVEEMVEYKGSYPPQLKPLAYFSPSWMPFIDSFYCPLTSGGTSVMWEPTEFQIGELAVFAKKQGVNWFVCVPAVLQGILDEAVAEPPGIVGVGGAPVPVQLAKDFFDAGGKTFLFGYSGTEQGNCSCSALHSKDEVDACTEPGQALFDLGFVRYAQKLCLVDEKGDIKREPGEIGEIVVAGPGLFSGYLGAKEDPFSPASESVAQELGCKPGDRVYRTKDLAKWHPKGGLRMTGRSDSMVKVRGLRIDLGEVSEVLQTAPGVKEVVVVVSNDTLAAYVGPASAVDVQKLRAHCAEKLAKYMVPSLWKAMDEWPRLSNGKIDKKNLPAIVAERGEFVPPEGAVETQIAGIWSAVLGSRCQGQVGRTDFLEMFGATSVDMSLIVSKVRKAGYSLSIKQVYDTPILQDFAAAVAGSMASTGQEVKVCVPEAWFTAMQGLFVCFLVVLFGILYAGEYMCIYLAFSHFGIPFNALTTTVALSVVWSAHLWAMAGAFLLITKIPGVRLKPGIYPMYSKEHLILWFYWRLFDRCVGEFSAGGMLGASLLSATDGSVWTNRIYRILGAKIGANTVIDIHTGLGYLLFPHLVTIGKGVSMNKGAKIRTFEFRDGNIIVQPVFIGDNVHVGAMSVIMPGAVIEDNAVLAPRSVVPMGGRVQGIVVGSPLQKGEETPYMSAEADPLKVSWPAAKAGLVGLGKPLLESCPNEEVIFNHTGRNWAMFAGLFATTVLSSCSLIPAIGAAFWIYAEFGKWGAIISLPFCSLVSDLVLLLLVLIAKPLLVGTLKPGDMAINTWAYFRFWIFSQIFRSAQVVTMTLNKSPICLAWLNAMGVKIGRETVYWVAQSSTFLPDLTHMGRYGFLGGVAMLGTSVVHNGRVVFNRIHCGDNFVIAQQAYVPPGTTMKDGSVIGAGACPYGQKELPENSVWFGTPAMRLSVPPFQATHPSTFMLFVHFLFVVLQTTLMKLFDTQVPAFINVNVISLLNSDTSLLLYPFVLASIWVTPVIVVAIMVLIWKWVVCGTFHPCEHDMYSVWCFKRDLTISLRRWPESQIVSLFKGTPWISIWYRALGAKIGKHVYMETLTMEETDVHDVQDGAVLMDGSGLDSHTVEGRTWKVDEIKVGRGAVIETNAMVLKGASLADGAQLGALSTVMANEEVPAGHWLGAPIAPDTFSKLPSLKGADDVDMPDVAAGA